MRKARWVALFAIGAVWLTACKGSGTAPNPPTATVPARLYLANASNSGGSAPGSLLEFALPISNDSAPLVSVAPPAATVGPFGLALDTHQRVFVGYQGNEISVYKLPLTPASAPAFQIATPAGTAQALAFDGTGNLIAGIGNSVYEFPAPLSASSTASFNFLLPNGNHCCLQQFAVHGNTLAVATFTGFTDHVYVYSLPLTAASTPTVAITSGGSQGYSGVAFDASGNLYAAGGNPNQIEVYAPPYSSPPVTIIPTTTLGTSGNLAFDAQGNMYYDVSFPGILYEYLPPFTAASTPVVHTTIGLGSLEIGIAIGN